MVTFLQGHVSSVMQCSAPLWMLMCTYTFKPTYGIVYVNSVQVCVTGPDVLYSSGFYCLLTPLLPPPGVSVTSSPGLYCLYRDLISFPHTV